MKLNWWWIFDHTRYFLSIFSLSNHLIDCALQILGVECCDFAGSFHRSVRASLHCHRVCCGRFARIAAALATSAQLANDSSHLVCLFVFVVLKRKSHCFDGKCSQGICAGMFHLHEEAILHRDLVKPRLSYFSLFLNILFLLCFVSYLFLIYILFVFLEFVLLSLIYFCFAVRNQNKGCTQYLAGANDRSRHGAALDAANHRLWPLEARRAERRRRLRCAAGSGAWREYAAGDASTRRQRRGFHARVSCSFFFWLDARYWCACLELLRVAICRRRRLPPRAPSRPALRLRSQNI